MKRLLGAPQVDQSAAPAPPPTVDPQLETLARWQRVVEVAPDNLDARLHVIATLQRLGRKEELHEALDETMARFPDDRRVNFQFARYLLNSNDNDAALERWSEIETRWPGDVEAIGNVGFLLVRLGRAEEALQKADELDALDADRASRLRIKAYTRLDRCGEAIEALEAIRSRRALDEQESCELAQLRFTDGDVAAAEKLAIATLERAPCNTALVKLMIRILEQQDKHQEALDLLERSSLDSTAASFKRTKSIGLMIALERFDDADRRCAEALAGNPDDTDLLLLHARCAQHRFGSLRAA